MVIISVEQDYKSTEEWHDYKTSTGTIYRGQEISMNIGKTKDNYNKDKRPKCFNYNKYGHITKKC